MVLTTCMYTHAILGGTFDHLHVGHHAFLTHAFSIATHVTIGLTTDGYVRTHKTTVPVDEAYLSGAVCPCITIPSRQSYDVRLTVLTRWLDMQGWNRRYTIVPIEDVIGPAGTMEADVIVVSEETKRGAKTVNIMRKQHGLSLLAVSVFPMMRSMDHRPISSTRIRNQEIDVDGKLVMPDALRPELVKPIGDVIEETHIDEIIRADMKRRVITVGDKTTDRLLEVGVIPTLAIIDRFVERKPYALEMRYWDLLPKRHKEFVSGPGFINRHVISVLTNWGSDPKPMTLIVKGEEDLLVLPAILYAPIGSIVYYGQPHIGLVRVIVTKEKQRVAQRFLTRFIAQ